MPGQHAYLSASASSRWIACPPSAKLNANIKDTESESAKEGTVAHELGEIKLLLATKKITKAKFNKLKLNVVSSEYYNQEMEEFTDMYVNFVMEKYAEALATTKDAIISIEERIDFSHLVAEGFGTGDAVIIADSKMYICDLKYGKGVPVDSENNSQLMIYSLGALNAYQDLYDITSVEINIIQPRINNSSSWEISVKELEAWAKEVLTPASKLAWEGKGEFNPGEKQCRFCKVRKTCRARAEHVLTFIDGFDFEKPDQLSNEEIAEILIKADDIQAWAKEVQDYALNEAMKGEEFRGWKLVEGRSNRKIVDEIAAINALELEGFTKEDITETKIKALGKLEKLVGKAELPKVLEGLIEKPQGKPVLVTLSDKRAPLNIVTVEKEFDYE